MQTVQCTYILYVVMDDTVLNIILNFPALLLSLYCVRSKLRSMFIACMYVYIRIYITASAGSTVGQLCRLLEEIRSNLWVRHVMSVCICHYPCTYNIMHTLLTCV